LLLSAFGNSKAFTGFARQVLVRAVDPVQALTRDVREPRQPGAVAEVDRVEAVLLHQIADRARLADDEVALELDAELLQVLDLALHDRFREPELRDALLRNWQRRRSLCFLALLSRTCLRQSAKGLSKAGGIILHRTCLKKAGIPTSPQANDPLAGS